MASSPTAPAPKAAAHTSQNGRQGKLGMIEVARGLAALAVVVFHANASAPFYGGPTYDWMSPFEYGVDFFFVLSGFVIMLAHHKDIGRPSQAISYLTKRAIRLFPILWVVVLGLAAARYAYGTEIDLAQFTRSLLPYPSLLQTMPQVVWTLRHELLFYGLFVFLILSVRFGSAVLIIWLVAVGVQFAAAILGRPITGVHAFYLSSFHFDFFIGIALALIHRRNSAFFTPWPLIIGIAALIGWLAYREPLGLSRISQADYTSIGATIGVLITGAIFGVIVHGLLSIESRIRAPKVLVALGAASYVLYLIHTPINSVSQRAVKHLPQFYLDWGAGHAILVVAGVVISLMLHSYLEKPMVNGLRRWLVDKKEPIEENDDTAHEPIEMIQAELLVENDHDGIGSGNFAKGSKLNWFKSIFSRKIGLIEADSYVDEATANDAVSGRLWDRPSDHSVAIGRAKSLPQFTFAGNRGPTSTAFAGQMSKLRKSFTPSHPISNPDLFAGRRELLLRLIHLIEDQRLHVVLYGDRGIGKTSILRIVSGLAENANYRVVYASCGSDTSFDNLCRSYAKEIPLLYHADYEPTDKRVEEGGVFADLLSERDVTVADITSLFEKIDSTQLLLIVDEFDRVESNRMREQLAELIKNLSDRSISVQFLTAGVASNLAALVSHIPSIRRNLIGLPVDPLSSDEITEIVENGAGQSDVTFLPEAIEMLIDYSKGLPYLAHLIGLHASMQVFQDERTEVTTTDVADAAFLATEELGLRISAGGHNSIKGSAERVGWTSLGELAKTAMLNIGRLDEADLADVDDATRAALFAADDAEKDREDTTTWKFREDAVLPYIWLNSLLHNRVDSHAAASREFDRLKDSVLRFDQND